MTRLQEPSSGCWSDRTGPAWREQRGQSLIILAFAMVALLALMGLALDLGIVYGRRVQLARATDAAAMAAVVEPSSVGTDILALRAEEFMRANSLPQAAVVATRVVSPDLGTARLVRVDSTFTVTTMFMHLVGVPRVLISESSLAAFESPAEFAVDQPTPITSSITYGVVRNTNLMVIGSGGQASLGEAYLPLEMTTGVPNPNHTEARALYPFRIYIPPEYPSGEQLVVEILDPGGSNLYCGVNFTYSPTTGDPTCMDQTTAGTALTTYTLLYFDADGARHDIATKTYGNDNADTELQWVNAFLVTLSDYPIATSPSGSRSLYLEVKAGGAGANGFHLWAGPPNDGLPKEVDLRNALLMTSPSREDTGGVIVYAQGRLPMNTNPKIGTITMTLAYIPPEAGGHAMHLSIFDANSPPGQLQLALEGAPAFTPPAGQLSGDDNWATTVFQIPSANQFFGAFLVARYTNGPYVQANPVTWRLEYDDLVTQLATVRLVE